MSTVLASLYKLLQKSAKWVWFENEKQGAKELLTSSSLFVHFDPKLKLTLAGDALAYGLGVVLAHKYPNGLKCPIEYASRAVAKTEKNYSQLEKELAFLVSNAFILSCLGTCLT